jgi:dienelactone hydrolase
MIQTQCDGCFREYRLDDKFAGKTIRCKDCGTAFKVTSGGPVTFVEEGADEEDGPPAPTRAPAGRKPGSRKPSGKSRSSSGSKAWIWWLVGGGLLAGFLVCGGGIWLAVSAIRSGLEAALSPAGQFGDPRELFPAAAQAAGAGAQPTLVEARKSFTTNIIYTELESYGPPDSPDGTMFDLVKYQSPVGGLAAYVTRDPGDGQKHPAIVWITGGDCNSIGDVWSPQDRSNDQSASAFRDAGIVMMFPSLRGGNDNPGQREGFYGEVEDILAATDHLAALPYVDPGQVYLGGHSTGGTLVMLVGCTSSRYKGIFAFGPVAGASQYGGEFVYCDPQDEREMALRSPSLWLHCVQSPMYVFEGEIDGNWYGSIDLMAERNTNPQIQFFQVPGHDHFSVIAPVTEKLAQQIVAGQLNISEEMVQNLQ